MEIAKQPTKQASQQSSQPTKQANKQGSSIKQAASSNKATRQSTNQPSWQASQPASRPAGQQASKPAIHPTKQKQTRHIHQVVKEAWTPSAPPEEHIMKNEETNNKPLAAGNLTKRLLRALSRSLPSRAALRGAVRPMASWSQGSSAHGQVA